MQETKYAVEIRTWRKFPFHSFPEFVQVSPQLYVAKNVTLLLRYEMVTEWWLSEDLDERT